jgi:hypothetical protein
LQGLSIMRVPEQREQREAELSRSMTAKRIAIDNLLMSRATPALRAQHTALADKLVESAELVDDLGGALAIPLKQRLELLFAYKVRSILFTILYTLRPQITASR